MQPGVCIESGTGCGECGALGICSGADGAGAWVCASALTSRKQSANARIGDRFTRALMSGRPPRSARRPSSPCPRPASHRAVEWMRDPYEALTSECVTCTIVVPSRFSCVNSSMISLAWLECRLPVGSSANKQRRLVNDRACDAHQLLLSAGKLVGIEVFLGDDLKVVEGFGDHALPLAARDVFVRQRKVDVLLHSQVVKQVIALEDHADLALGQLGAVLSLHQVDRLARRTSIRRPIGRRAGRGHSVARTSLLLTGP